MTAATLPPADTIDQSEFGATVADAQRLLRRAKCCFVFVRVGTNPLATELLDIPRRVMSAELKRRSASNAFPCELSPSAAGDGSILLLGHSTAIEAAEARR